MTASSWQVHKFGGTSVAGAERYRGVAAIMESDLHPKKAIVVSAMSGVTNALIELVDLAKARDDSYMSKLTLLKSKHTDTIATLLGTETDSSLAFAAKLSTDFAEIQEILRGIWLAKGCSELTSELISGYGEIWSAQLLNGYFNSNGVLSAWMDARDVLVVEPDANSVTIDWDASSARLLKWLETHDASTLVITGFIASTASGAATTLKRNGSDYSASIFGALLKASAITIWTDVDGVLSADPRLVPEAVVLDELSYKEATELAYFGAKVVHPSTMAPAIAGNIPIWIRNSFNPRAKGTLIKATATSDRPVKGFASIDHMALVNVEGTGMIGVPGVAQRLFGALREVGVSVVMISQASSEHSICFAIPETQAPLAKKTVEAAFFGELHHGQIQTIDVVKGCSILAIVGDNMVEQPGIGGKFFTALGKAGVSIRAIAQGSSERNISAVIDGKDARRALRAAHSAFYLSNQTLSIGIVGAGLIGSTLLDQLGRELERLRQDFKIDLRVRGILNSKTMFLADPQIDLSTWKEQWRDRGVPANMELFARHVRAEYLPHAVIIDATASEDVTKNYPKWLQQGLHIITPNKKANSASLESYRHLHAVARKEKRHFLYATNVGAGLPFINTLRDLVRTGDVINRIEGVFSGTLSFLFNNFDGTRPFSEIVREARAKGFTEPDPRDDLAGADVARKLVILAREMGLPLELKDIAVENLVPSNQRQGSVDEWLMKLPEGDALMRQRWANATGKNAVLRYVGVIDPQGETKVELREYPLAHPFAGLNASDNIVAYHTDRYRSQPLVIKGPGAGPEVTAAGVFSDLLRLASFVGDRE